MSSRKGLPLKFDYRMMALIREVVGKELHQVWMERYASNFNRNTPPKAFKNAYKIVIEDCRNPWLRQGLCNLILEEINRVEALIQANIKGLGFECPKCGSQYIVDQEPKGKQDFMYLPKWRELSCGHIVGITGRILTDEEVNKLREVNQT